MSQFSAFGASAQKPTGSLFGSFAGQGQQQQQQPATSLFGGQAAGTNTGIFGANNAANASQPAQPSTSIFGNSTAQPQQQQQQPAQPTGLFGQPAAGSNLFGVSSNANTNTNASQPAQGTTTGLFGTNTQSQAQPGGLGLGFGASQPAPGAFGGFGASTTGQANPTTPSLFGQNTQYQQQQQLQQQQQQQSNASTGPLFTRTTKFNDLPEEVRKKFEQIDSHIQGRVQISDELKQHKLGEEPQKGSEQIRSVHKDLVNSINKLRADIASMRELRARMDQAVSDTIAATRIIDAFKSPQNPQQSAWLKNYSGFPLEFFSRVTGQLHERLQWANNTLEQIERKLVSEANHVSITPQSITSTLQAQHASFVALAAKAAALDAELQRLKDTYRTLWRARTGSARDPFSAVDRGAFGSGEFGLEGLSVK